VVAAPAEAVVAVDQLDLHVYPLDRSRGHFGDVSAELLGWRVVPGADDAVLALQRGVAGKVGVVDARAEDSDGVVVDGVKGGVLASADSVDVPVAFDVDAGVLQRLGQVRGAVETLLFACSGDKHHCCFRLAHLRYHARHLH